MVNQIYPLELQLNSANASASAAPSLNLPISISNGFVSSKIYDKRDDFGFDIVIFPFFMVAVPVIHLLECTFLNLSLLGVLSCDRI